VSADLLATLRGFSREDVDSFAVESQRKAAAAIERGDFDRSLVPVTDRNGLTVLGKDEHPRAGTDVAGLAKLKPSFEMMGRQFGLDSLTKRVYPQVERIEHVHHAGNSSGIVDGAAAILFGSRKKGQSLGLEPRAKIRAVASIGSEPMLMLDGPIPVTRKILERAGMSIDDIDLFEVNEAFAAVPMAYMQEFNIDPAKLNVNGGAIALGHPLGATGCILLGTLLDALEQHDKNVGLVTLCIGGGMGVATIIERV
jgi:acetyl-CoA C-acetyltransferase